MEVELNRFTANGIIATRDTQANVQNQIISNVGTMQEVLNVAA
jgi:hypothetical protein